MGDWVLYPTENGPEVCRVVWAPEPSSEEPAAALPLCAGRADADALARDERNRAARAEAMAVSRELVARHGLAMKVVAVDLVDRAIDVDRMIDRRQPGLAAAPTPGAGSLQRRLPLSSRSLRTLGPPRRQCPALLRSGRAVSRPAVRDALL